MILSTSRPRSVAGHRLILAQILPRALLAAALSGSTLLAGCGQKGPLLRPQAQSAAPSPVILSSESRS